MKVLLASASFAQTSNAPVESLAHHGFEIVRNPYGRRMTAPEVIEVAKGCAGIVSGLEPLSRDVLTALPTLRCISRVGSGVDNVDTEAAAELGIAVRTTPEAPVRAVAELALGLVIDLLRGVTRHDRELRAGRWKKRPGRLLTGLPVGIVGLGRIGRELASMLVALGAEVSACDVAPERQWAEDNHVQIVPLETLLPACDVVSVHVSRRASDPPLIGAHQLASMREGAFLVNVSRGQVVDEPALVSALRESHLGGAAIDVFESEPYRGPLTDFDNVIVTPHIGSAARETIQQMEQEAVDNLIRGLEGAT